MRSALPKILHTSAGIPLVEHVTRLADQAGATLITLVVSPDTLEPVQARLGAGYSYAVQAEARGTGHAVLQARAALEGRADEVLVLYGADPLMRPESVQALLEARRSSGALVGITTFEASPPTGYGRIIRDAAGQVSTIVEERSATAAQRRISEVNQGVAVYDAAFLWAALSQLAPDPLAGEYYLTDLVALALAERGPGAVVAQRLADPDEALGVNDRAQLAQATAIITRRKLEALMRDGVTIIDPRNTVVELDVVIGPDSVVLPGCMLCGATRIGAGAEIGPHTTIIDSVIGDNCRITHSVVEYARMERGASIGPFGHLRKGAHLLEDVHMGNFGEVKNATLGAGSKMGHFSYVGDATIGANVNIGAGTITCNFSADGRKERTIIGDNAFIGSDTLLRAPVSIGPGAITGAGSVVTKDIPAGAVAVGMPARVIRRNAADQTE